METNNKTNSTEEVITLARADNSVMQLLGDIDTCCGDSCNMFYEMITFDSTYSFNRSYTFTRGYINLNLDTTDTLAHEGGTDGAYSFKFSSTDTQLSCQIIDTDDWSIIGEFCGNSVNVAMLLSDEKLYKIIIEPYDKNSTVTIDVDISYTVYTNIGQIDVADISKPIAVRKNDKFTLHFENSIENNCTWTSSNPSIISVGRTSGLLTAHKLGTATITFTNPCGCSYSVVVRSVIDYVDIVDEGHGLQKIIFRSTNKIWYCVYCDSVFTTNISDITAKRNNLNYYVSFDVEENQPLSDEIREFNNEELQLIYAIDPLGVANYINRVTYNWSVVNAMNKKDEYFKLFFGRAPWYFNRDSFGEWRRVVKPTENINDYLSESELIMGKHPIWDEYSIITLITDLFELIKDILSMLIPAIKLVDTFLKNHQSLDDIIKIYQLSKCDTFKDLVSNTSENILSEMYDSTAFGWANILISATSTFTNFLDNVAAENTLYPQVFEYCIGEHNYETYICKNNNEKYKLNDLRDYILNK